MVVLSHNRPNAAPIPSPIRGGAILRFFFPIEVNCIIFWLRFRKSQTLDSVAIMDTARIERLTEELIGKNMN